MCVGGRFPLGYEPTSRTRASGRERVYVDGIAHMEAVLLSKAGVNNTSAPGEVLAPFFHLEIDVTVWIVGREDHISTVLVVSPQRGIGQCVEGCNSGDTIDRCDLLVHTTGERKHAPRRRTGRRCDEIRGEFIVNKVRHGAFHGGTDHADGAHQGEPKGEGECGSRSSSGISRRVSRRELTDGAPGQSEDAPYPTDKRGGESAAETARAPTMMATAPMPRMIMRFRVAKSSA